MDTATDVPLRPHRADALHPDGQYSTGAKLFHWLTVPLLLLALATGLVIEFIDEKVKMGFYALHESTGLIILLVASARLAWRLTHRPPAHPDHLPPLLRRGANAVHHLLYLALIVQPLLGFFATNAFGFPLQGETAFLGFIDLPKFMATNEPLGNALITAHAVVGWSLLVLIPLHIAGAIFHHAVRRDGTLLRMI
jgi:cytochrome b561